MTDLHARAEQLAVVLGINYDHEGIKVNVLSAVDVIESALRQVRADECEACAKVAEDEKVWCEENCEGDIVTGQIGASSRIAAAIRRLKETP